MPPTAALLLYISMFCSVKTECTINIDYYITNPLITHRNYCVFVSFSAGL